MRLAPADIISPNNVRYSKSFVSSLSVIPDVFSSLRILPPFELSFLCRLRRGVEM